MEYFQSFLGYVTMPVVVVFLGGLFWARPPRHAAFWTLAIGIPVGLAGFAAFEFAELIDLQFLYGTGLMLLLSLAIFVGVTLRGEAPELEEDTTFTRQTWTDETSELSSLGAWQNPRYLGAGLAVRWWRQRDGRAGV